MSNLVARLLTAVVVVPVLLYSLFWAPWWAFFSIVVVASAVSAMELSGMTLAGYRGLQVWSVIATLGVLAVFYFAPSSLAVTSAVLGVIALGFLFALFSPDPIESAGNRMGWLVVTPLFAGGMLSAIAQLHRLDHGGAWVALAMMLAWFGDTGGYFAGRAFGKHKLYPKVSPKKTIEGAVGGAAASIGGALLAHFWFLPDLPLVHGIALGLIASIVGQAGDLTISLIKRSTGFKDSGFIVPGHGGLLDRIDALVMTGLATWLYAVWFLPPS
ncbi:MAG: phosphatidate cytidylyltransferase [Deltaproteobacteria bacterium]|nr:phosphatidate cytidylyltransferase [Deltaproteobacteria bacterium]